MELLRLVCPYVVFCRPRTKLNLMLDLDYAFANSVKRSGVPQHLSGL